MGTRHIHLSMTVMAHIMLFRADFRFAPSQWETALLCNDVSYWLGASLDSALLLLRKHQLRRNKLVDHSYNDIYQIFIWSGNTRAKPHGVLLKWTGVLQREGSTPPPFVPNSSPHIGCNIICTWYDMNHVTKSHEHDGCRWPLQPGWRSIGTWIGSSPLLPYHTIPYHTIPYHYPLPNTHNPLLITQYPRPRPYPHPCSKEYWSRASPAYRVHPTNTNGCNYLSMS